MRTLERVASLTKCSNLKILDANSISIELTLNFTILEKVYSILYCEAVVICYVVPYYYVHCQKHLAEYH